MASARKNDNRRQTSTSSRPRREREKGKDGGQPLTPIVGLGASAGGVQALKRFFSALPADASIAYVVIMHLSPERESRMAEVLQRFTRMPVREAEDGTKVVADHVYVIPPGKLLQIVEGRLRVTDDPPAHRQRMPIDLFFRSLAEDQEANAVCAVLSGAGSDGTLGLEAVKAQGGLTLAEQPDEGSPESDWWSGMPRSAAATGVVDLVAAAEELAEHLVAYVKRLRDVRRHHRWSALQQDISAQLDEISNILLSRKGWDFRHYKSGTLIRRVERRLHVLSLDKATDYVAHLREDSREVELLAKEMLIHVTGFFRDPDAFAALKESVVRPLVREKNPDQMLRTWVVGCSSGQESYSVAILFREVMREEDASPGVQIFATDIDPESIETARAGRYPPSIAHDLSDERLEKFFVEEGNGYRIDPEIRNMCVFSEHDVINAPPFSGLDLICCRNLLIYFESNLQKRLLPVFHYALKNHGYLFLGGSENAAQHQKLFTPLDTKHRIFRRSDDTKRLPLDMPLLASSHQPRAGGSRSEGGGNAPRGNLAQRVATTVLEDYAPPHVVVDGHNAVAHFSRGTGRFLEPAPGTARHDVFDMARPGLRSPLRAALHKVAQDGTRVEHANVHVNTETGPVYVDLAVAPFAQGDGENPLYLVIFREKAQEASRAGAAAGSAADGDGGAAESDAEVKRLEQELAASREDLQTMVEQLETSNEELRSANEELLSMNEELQSSNEELESSKEELQSVNEELETVNQELNQKIAELHHSQQNLEILLNSTRIAMLFLDEKMRIRRFTADAKRLFRVIDSDVGRPLPDITAKFEAVDLSAEIRQCLRTGELVQRQVHLADEHATFLMRILPARYGETEDRSLYAILTFTDVSNLEGI